MTDIDSLISTLSSEAKPIRLMPRPFRMGVVWGVGIGLYLALMLAYSGFRPDLAAKLHMPLFAAEIGLLGLILLASGISAMLLSVPDMYQKPALAQLPLLLAPLFGVILILGWLQDNPPSPPPAHNVECTLCILLYSLVPTLGLFVSMRRMASIRPGLAGGVALLGASSFGALVLRLSEPTDSFRHLLTWHYLPMLAFSLAGLWLGRRWLRW